MMVQGVIDSKLNRRNTKQRQLILGIIEQADEHFDAEQIYERARQMSPSISLSTVYRNLQLFTKVGLLREHQFNSMRRRYEIATRYGHHHLMCIGCGRIFEFRCPSSEELKTRITREEGFRVTDAEVRLVGYCPECQRRLSDKNANAELERR
jgi:Fe2+ or Zn2+ uptake regulation protein